ncbi:MAG: sigma 54-interacting transcriptional regulator [Planctomycetaceae bacterium]|nr:sigma 54-interacting transcriptional regulator [Planctomycetaceae bacterium]
MQDAIVEAKNRFLRNLPIPDGAVRAEILASWRRSRDFGVQPGKVDKTVLPVADLQARIAARLPFYDMAVPLMESLHEFTTGSGFLTTLSDEEGYVLRLLGDPDITALAAKNALVEGCNRSERRIGTNAIGTPLETGRPIQVFGSEHFYDPHVVWVCSGAPIFDARGAITGSICIIGTYDKVSFHTLGMAAAAAEAITRQLKMKAAYDTIDAIRSRMDVMLENMQNGVLLLDKHMVVQQANNLAGTMLGRTREELNGIGFRELFGDVVQPGGVADFHDRPVTVSHRGRERNLSLSLMTTDDGEFVAILERVETLHKRANKVMGSEARFTFADVIGESVELKTAIGMAQTAARTNANILLLGESGTGKELFAQSIHNASDRRSGPFVAINCGALPKSLIQSELFGYEGGSFTGASRDGAAGKFELANGGTIFLDEIGDMPFDVQVTLLRVLQTREVVRIGGKNPSASMSASSPRPTAIWRKASPTTNSGKTSITASTSSPSPSRPCGNGRAMSASCPSTCCARLPAPSTNG